MPLDPKARLILDQLAAQGGLRITDLSPDEVRKAFLELRLPLPAEPVASIENRMLPGPGGDVPVRIYRPESAPTRAPAVLFYHGGGWVIGDLDSHERPCCSVANRSGAVVVSVDYRLAPEAPFPSAPADCYAALSWVAENGEEIGVDGSRLAVAGDSAGGNLAAVVALMARDRSGPPIRHQTLIYPATDCDFDRPSYHENASGYLLERDAMEWFWGHYVADPAERTRPYASPMRAEDLSGLPPALVVTAEFDPLRDEGEAYARRLADAGNKVELTRYDGMIHGFVAFEPVVDQARQLLDQAGDALRSALA